MGRETLRRVANSPNLVHTEVLRDFAGSVQMTSISTTSGQTVKGTTSSTVFTTKVDNEVAFTSAKITIKGGGGGNTATANLIRNGSTILSTSSTGTSTTSQTQVTHTTPINSPTYSLKVTASGGTATGTVNTLSREKRI